MESNFLANIVLQFVCTFIPLYLLFVKLFNYFSLRRFNYNVFFFNIFQVNFVLSMKGFETKFTRWYISIRNSFPQATSEKQTMKIFVVKRYRVGSRLQRPNELRAETRTCKSDMSRINKATCWISWLSDDSNLLRGPRLLSLL